MQEKDCLNLFETINLFGKKVLIFYLFIYIFQLISGAQSMPTG